ncbi:unnamed protein product, partial [Pelagomonas calceolata]
RERVRLRVEHVPVQGQRRPLVVLLEQVEVLERLREPERLHLVHFVVASRAAHVLHGRVAVRDAQVPVDGREGAPAPVAVERPPVLEPRRPRQVEPCLGGLGPQDVLARVRPPQRRVPALDPLGRDAGRLVRVEAPARLAEAVGDLAQPPGPVLGEVGRPQRDPRRHEAREVLHGRVAREGRAAAPPQLVEPEAAPRVPGDEARLHALQRSVVHLPHVREGLDHRLARRGPAAQQPDLGQVLVEGVGLGAQRQLARAAADALRVQAVQVRLAPLELVEGPGAARVLVVVRDSREVEHLELHRAGVRQRRAGPRAPAEAPRHAARRRVDLRVDGVADLARARREDGVPRQLVGAQQPAEDPDRRLEDGRRRRRPRELPPEALLRHEVARLAELVPQPDQPQRVQRVHERHGHVEAAIDGPARDRRDGVAAEGPAPVAVPGVLDRPLDLLAALLQLRRGDRGGRVVRDGPGRPRRRDDAERDAVLADRARRAHLEPAGRRRVVAGAGQGRRGAVVPFYARGGALLGRRVHQRGFVHEVRAGDVLVRLEAAGHVGIGWWRRRRRRRARRLLGRDADRDAALVLQRPRLALEPAGRRRLVRLARQRRRGAPRRRGAQRAAALPVHVLARELVAVAAPDVRVRAEGARRRRRSSDGLWGGRRVELVDAAPQRRERLAHLADLESGVVPRGAAQRRRLEQCRGRREREQHVRQGRRARERGQRPHGKRRLGGAHPYA